MYNVITNEEMNLPALLAKVKEFSTILEQVIVTL